MDLKKNIYMMYSQDVLIFYTILNYTFYNFIIQIVLYNSELQ